MNARSRFVLTFALACPALAQPSFRSIGHLPGDIEGSLLAALSADSRFAIGYSVGGGQSHGFRWAAGDGSLTPLGDLPGGDVTSSPAGISAHGFHIVGYSKSASGTEAFRWQGNVMTGMGDLPGSTFSSYATAVSADGSIIIGSGQADLGGAPRQRAWMSVRGGPLTQIGDPMGEGGEPSTTVGGLSADGAVVVGTHSLTNASIHQAFRWTKSTGIVLLGDLPGGDDPASTGVGVSDDGSVAFGNATSNSGTEAFRWTAAGGMMGLGDLPEAPFLSIANGASADGSVIVGLGNYNAGMSTADAFIWDTQNGMRKLRDVLVGLGVQGLEGWKLFQATDVSPDGLTVIGVAIDPDGDFKGFVAHLGQAFGKGTERISIGSGEEQGNGGSTTGSVSDDGNIVAFWSGATNLVVGDTNAKADVFIRNRGAAWTTRVSLSTAGAQGNGDSVNPHTCGSGRYVVFSSDATNLVAGDTNGLRDIFLRDRQANTTGRISVSSGGAQANGASEWARITPDGRFVIFQSNATNLVAGDTNGATDVFLRDRQSGTTTRLSLTSGGVQGNGRSYDASISDNGLSAVFTSDAANLIAGDSNGSSDVFLRNRTTAVTSRISISTQNAQGNLGSFLSRISGNGRYIAFTTSATNLAYGDTNAADDVLVRDRFNGTTTRITLTPAQANGDSALSAISANGRFVLYNSFATNLVQGDTNSARDAFVHDNWTFVTERVGVGDMNQQAAVACAGTALSGNGRFAVFNSLSGNLLFNGSDTNGKSDVFLRDLRKP